MISADRGASLSLTSGWQLAMTPPGAIAHPSELDRLTDWVDAQVPGTAASALTLAGRFDPENPVLLHGKDVWYRCRIDQPKGRYLLKLRGLATAAEVFLDGERCLETRNMFREYTCAVELTGESSLAICFRALEPLLAQKGPRARWRPKLADSQGLRLVRTSLLGRMPGWCPSIHPVGPYRAIELTPANSSRIDVLRLCADLNPDGTARLRVAVRCANLAGELVLRCAGHQVNMRHGEAGIHEASLDLPAVTPWMPHTHGTPRLYDVEVLSGTTTWPLGKTGFRTITVDRGGDGKGFGLNINGVPVFARGAVWTNADLTGLSHARKDYRPLLQAARDAGMNMLRIGGTMLYESRAFFELCDELGILVWQDFQFANYDYPVKDPAFVEEVKAEVREQLRTLQGCPCLAVLCGGSEIYQQGAMMGLPENRWKGPLCEEILPELAAEGRPDVPYVANSPSGGVLPFSPNEGIAHYYGVGAYQRPLEDARRADIRFAAECLAFSNIPEQQTLDEDLAAAPGHDPRWKARVPRDRGAGWDFEDVRDYYLKDLFGLDPAALRYGDPERYLDLGRLVTAEVMERTFGEWRRAGSPCRGALVWTLQDLEAGAGWGVIDAKGRPKSAYYALKRAFRPLSVSVTDEGTNGLHIHVVNDLSTERRVLVALSCLRNGRTKVVSGQKALALAAHGSVTFNAVELIGAFFDVTQAYRFGPPSHDAVVVRLLDAHTQELIADVVHFPLGFDTSRQDIGLAASFAGEVDGQYRLELTVERLARGVTISVDGYRPSDNCFTLAPGYGKSITLTPLPGAASKPQGRLRAINMGGSIGFGGA